jgi:plastocyanin
MPFSRRGEQAIQALQEADNLDATPRLSHGDEVVYSLEAKKARAKGALLLESAAPVTVSAGEAITWENQSEEIHKGANARIVETLEHPNTVTAGASGDRMSAALGAGVLEPAIDAAISAQARNSLEKMLCHQKAGAHFTAMRLLEQGANPNLQPGEAARFTNASARMMDAYQAACLTLLKLNTRGTQRVLVQYVNVGQGGQAVVAGRVGGGSRKRGRGAKNRG